MVDGRRGGDAARRLCSAYQAFARAEQAGGEDLLSTDERLELWIEQSKCLMALNRLDEAMRTLSHVINEDVASSLRIQAMYLRAEIYELQGRHELAVKQLEATSNKGGEWADKAKDRLETGLWL